MHFTTDCMFEMVPSFKTNVRTASVVPWSKEEENAFPMVKISLDTPFEAFRRDKNFAIQSKIYCQLQSRPVLAVVELYIKF